MDTKMTIINQMLPHKTINAYDPQHIPRVGERVEMGYSPAPTVTNVLHVFDGGDEHPTHHQIIVTVE